MKSALHIYTSLFRSHDLTWDRSGKKLLDFLNSGATVEPKKIRPDSEDQPLVYNEYTDTLRSGNNHMIASVFEGKWDFNTSATQDIELLAQKNIFDSI
jgi:hypothetical protein